jgi:hypothetical protein
MGTGLMTEMQQVALLNPAVVAEDCMNPLYFNVRGPWSIILTMNVGFE